MKRVGGALALAISSFFCAQTPTLASISVGHNLTPTSETLPAGEVTIGTYAVAYGLFENLTVGTSPWLLFNYNMPMVNLRWRFIQKPSWQVAVEGNYFKTIHLKSSWYQQESTFLRLTGSFKLWPAYSIHVSTGYQYFWDDTRPFSLRLPPQNGSRATVNAGFLHEFRLGERLKIYVETALLGLNYLAFFTHTGLSLAYQTPNWVLQAGYSVSTPTFDAGTKVFWKGQVIHPEVQLQTFF